MLNWKELGNIITDLIARQQLPNASHYFRMPALCAHLGICKIETSLVKKAVLTANVVSLILPLNDSDSEIRETAISLLFLFSQYGPERFVEYLFWPRRLKSFSQVLVNDENNVVQVAVAFTS